ncbi:DNA polymerase III, delta prime subunit [Caminicella sporogenes DSM 14501]|uniref:DNA polymerase III subunit delta' n=1 Tax=Caminicella sporogenes DSM 14501 TaxID=1121266 RepID=A0A1M6SDK3_9FIRM|nr:DNA polymerase III subunit delta' [Caminicella sporogenes]RKD26626.1 DNA polymerase III subunit delta' [Caminicella sporogenes]SHK42854.1 DNA polymerase III, delta prime subunit [Caminicella sporogenes DSM 14501]
MSFNDIIGHDNIIKFLKTAITNNKLAHAYVFDGIDGVGKMLTAKEFAKAINCKNNLNDACEICSSCIKINNNNHPDINIIVPDGNSIKNRQIEEFQNEILLKPYESEKKIFIIQNAETMTVSAQNRLLKILEEPPEYGIIILITENIYNLLPTIKSRCQIIKFHRIPKKYIENFLENNYNIEKIDSKLLAGFSDGSIGRAVELCISEEFKDRRETTIEVIDEIVRGDKLKLLDYVKFFEDNKEYIDQILDFFSIWFRDMLLLLETNEDSYVLNIDKINYLKIHGSIVEYEKIPKAIEIIEETRKNIKANVNFGLCIEMLLLNLQEV